MSYRPSLLSFNGLSVHRLNLLGCGLDLGEDDGVPSVVTEVLHPLDVQLCERRATPLARLEDNDTDGLLLVAHLLEEVDKAALRIVEPEWNHIARDLVLNLVGDVERKLWVFPESHLEYLKGQQLF